MKYMLYFKKTQNKLLLDAYLQLITNRVSPVQNGQLIKLCKHKTGYNFNSFPDMSFPTHTLIANRFYKVFAKNILTYMKLCITSTKTIDTFNQIYL